KYASDYVRNCLAVLQATGADNVGGPWVAEGTRPVGKAIAVAFQSPFSFGGARGHNPNYEGIVDTVYLGCWSRTLFDQVGMFDEELVRNQDDEFNLRLTRLGKKIWQSPTIKSWYRPRPSLVALFKQYMQYGYWKVRVLQKHTLPASVRHLMPGVFVFVITVLPLLAWSWPIAFKVWLGILGSYLICTLAASILTGTKAGWNVCVLLPIVFACYHFGYGYGFLRGVWDFVILRRRPNLAYTKLTRSSEEASLRGPA